MDALQKELEKRGQLLRKAIKAAEKEQLNFPEGSLRVSVDRGRARFYHVNGGQTYLKKEKQQLIKKLAQKDYNLKFCKQAKEELAAIEKCQKRLNSNDSEGIYSNQSKERQNLTTSYLQSNQEYAKIWQKSPYNTNPYWTEKKIYETKQGERVRSKSEAILADLFWDLGIPYRYEEEIQLRDGRVKYPDFTLLHVESRKEYYLEHLGLMDDAQYVQKNLDKMDDYRENGIYLGKNLLITYESETHPLDIKGIKKMLKELFSC